MHRVKDATENYLEAILVLEKKESRVRSIEVSRQLNVSRASVSTAVKNLVQEGYINVGPGGKLILTPAGRQLVETIYERHCLLREFLLRIGVSSDVAERDACKLEHAISEESHARLKNYILNTRK